MQQTSMFLLLTVEHIVAFQWNGKNKYNPLKIYADEESKRWADF